jgi:selenocysteine-specific elongation factor
MPGDSGVRHFILATAGHVDHGKTALTKALTGIDTDRLPEEKARGITIELGFAHLDLPGFSIGVIDVPGHEDFVRNMIAGVGAIDLALLMVAADDGWMPQTEEHLQILAYLGVNRGVIALTKSDLGDAESRAAEIRRQLQNSPFSKAPIVATSVRDQRGIEELKTALTKEFAQLDAARDFGKPRLFVDRVFTVRGSGTVVTGSLSGGSFTRGENVLVQPQNLSARIRGLQSHNQALELASPRRRLALNLADLAPDQISRGSTICGLRSARVSRVIDVLLIRSSRLPSTARPLCNGAILNLHFGSARITARVQLRNHGELLPNNRTIARLRLATPVHAFVGDRFILRDASERSTVAGGVVLDATPGTTKFRSHKQRALLDRRAAAPDDLETLLRTQLERDRFAAPGELMLNAPFSAQEIAGSLESLGKSGLIFLDRKIAADAGWWNSLRESVARLIDAEHIAHPERPGLEVNPLRNALRLENPDLFAALVSALARDGYRQQGNALRREDFRPSLPPHLEAAGEQIRAALRDRPLDPPGRGELASGSTQIQALRFLCERGEVVLINDDLAMGAEGIAKLKAAVEQQLRRRKSATVSELRQATGTTRRVIVPLLEYFDRLGLTKRTGDRRSLR